MTDKAMVRDLDKAMCQFAYYGIVAPEDEQEAERMSNDTELLYFVIGKRIKAAREKANLRQIDLAEKVGLTRTSIVNIEQGKQRIQLAEIYRVALALGLNLTDLLPECTDRMLMSHSDALIKWAEEEQ